MDSRYIEEMSNGPRSSHASHSGRAMASPTTVRTLTFSASTVRQTRSPSKDPECSTTFAPARNHMSDTHCDAACMSGARA